MNDWDAKNDPTKQFSPKFVYNIVNGGDNGGSYIDEVYDVLKTSGAVRYSEFTPLTSQGALEYLEWCTDTEALREALRYRVSSVKKYMFSDTSVNTPITSANDENLNRMKKLLTSNKVLAYSTDFKTWDMCVLSSESGSSHSGEMVCIKQYDLDDSLKDGHAMCIVGYDDNIKYDLNGDGVIQNFETGTFKVVNSHGVDWGNDGFMWVMYDALNKVSNCTAQNVANRNEIVEQYSYFVIEVKEYPCELIAEVTVLKQYRDDLYLFPGFSTLSSNIEQFHSYTFLNANGGPYNFSGTGTTVERATFPFDFGTIVAHPSIRQKYYVVVTGEGDTVIERIKIIDSSGKAVVDDTEQKTTSDYRTSYGYALGLVGDVDNNCAIEIDDATMINRYLSRIETLTDDQFRVADVDGNGKVDSIDATYIQRVVAQMDSGFINGVYVQLD